MPMVPRSSQPAAARRARVLALMAICFAVLLALSWQKWADLAIDGGREMNTPLRLLRGERLYSDVYYLYGPLAPYLNAGLYAVFGTHLNTLYAAGVIVSIAVLLLIFDLAAALTDVRAAALTTWTVLVFLAWRLPDGTAKELARFLPDCVTTVRRLRKDPRVPRRAKVAVLIAGLWVISPIDLIPEFLPVIGPLDDVVVVALALRYAARSTSREALLDAWPGKPEVIERLLGRGDRAS